MSRRPKAWTAAEPGDRLIADLGRQVVDGRTRPMQGAHEGESEAASAPRHQSRLAAEIEADAVHPKLLIRDSD